MTPRDEALRLLRRVVEAHDEYGTVHEGLVNEIDALLAASEGEQINAGNAVLLG